MPSGELVQVPAAALFPGDRVLVRPGERVPADGTIINGTSEIDESLVTGETLYRPVRAGATIYAGSINMSGALTVRVTAVGAGTLVDEVERLLDKASQARSQTVRLADRAARLYAPVVHATAALTASRLVDRRRRHSRFDRHRDRRPDHHLPVRDRARNPRGAGGRGRLRCFAAASFSTAASAIERLAEADTIVFDKTGTSDAARAARG